MISLLLVALGIALLFAGGELLVSSSIRLANRFGVSNRVIGLTVVAFATSAPELAATLTAAVRGVPDLGVGNVLGSNVANLALILGLSLLLMPLVVHARFLQREGAFMIAATVILYPLMRGGRALSRPDGVVLVALLAAFLYYLLTEPETAPPLDGAIKPWPLWLAVTAVVVSVGVLVGGAQVLVEGAVGVARALAVPDRVIGLTVVAVGTSLPELAASLVAARRGEGDLVTGNLIGSNVFNILGILGLTAIVSPLPIEPTAFGLDYAVMLVTSLVTVAFMTRKRLSRGEGAVLLAGYAAYTAWLFVG